jgi:hypothetical protein
MRHSVVVVFSLLELVSERPESFVVELEEVNRLRTLPGVKVGGHQVLEGEGVIAQDLRHPDPLLLIGYRFIVQVEVENFGDLL